MSGLPNSYIENEDTVFARIVHYSPTAQFDRYTSRIKYLEGYGIPLEIIILGGSFSALKRSYRKQFFQALYKHIDQIRIKQMVAFLCSIVTVEARPDQINQDECDFLRELGISKVEIGIQHVDDTILYGIDRGHSLEDTISATRLLRVNGFKVGYHVMLGLPRADFESDHRMLCRTLWLPELSPDFLKVYPCELLRKRRYQPQLWNLYETKKWHPPTIDYIERLVSSAAASFPKTVRVSRILRQFNEDEVVLPRPRYLHRRLKGKCRCIRCREVGKSSEEVGVLRFNDCQIDQHENGKNTCIQLTHRNLLVALARIYRVDESSSVLRELHVYGQARNLGTAKHVQGNGIGSKLLQLIEDMVCTEKQERLLVNAAVGARGFFYRRGYVLNIDGYLEKNVGEQENSYLQTDSESVPVLQNPLMLD